MSGVLSVANLYEENAQCVLIVYMYVSTHTHIYIKCFIEKARKQILVGTSCTEGVECRAGAGSKIKGTRKTRGRHPSKQAKVYLVIGR